MRAQRPADAAPAIAARAEHLPFGDDSFDAAMACVTIHHWESAEAGLAELRRVARGPVVVFTFELDDLPAWQQDHFSEGLVVERPRFPAITDVAAALGGSTRVERIPTPGDCEDGFFEAFWRRPEAMLDAEVRACHRAAEGGPRIGRMGRRARVPTRDGQLRRRPAPGDL
jgi:SAM-dependent methyltransferase